MPVCEDAIIKASSIAEYTEQVFSMYGGETPQMLFWNMTKTWLV